MEKFLSHVNKYEKIRKGKYSVNVILLLFNFDLCWQQSILDYFLKFYLWPFFKKNIPKTYLKDKLSIYFYTVKNHLFNKNNSILITKQRYNIDPALLDNDAKAYSPAWSCFDFCAVDSSALLSEIIRIDIKIKVE